VLIELLVICIRSGGYKLERAELAASNPEGRSHAPINNVQDESLRDVVVEALSRLLWSEVVCGKGRRQPRHRQVSGSSHLTQLLK